MDKLWLPTGRHSDLRIERDRGQDAGTFTGGGWKLCWHITVSPWAAVDSMVNVLKAKNAAPHLVIGGRPGTSLPVVVQMLPFNRAGRALQHTLPQETNRANCIQVEICSTVGSVLRDLDGEQDRCDLFDLPDVDLPAELARTAEYDVCMLGDETVGRAYHSGVAAWTDDTYKALANLASWIVNRVPIPDRCARTFQNTQRFTGQGWVDAAGHLGHMHCPGNSHYDPTTAFKGKHLVGLLDGAPYQL